MKSAAIAALSCTVVCASAHAGIIYSGELNETFTNNWQGNVTSVQNIAGAQFEFGIDNMAFGTPPVHWAYFAPISNDAAVFMKYPSSYGAYNFSEGDIIDRPDEYLRGPMTGDGFDGAYWFCTFSSAFLAQSEVYTGFVVGSGDDRKVGWAHMVIDWSSNDIVGSIMASATLKGWAYNDVPGGSIMAGQTEAMQVVPGVAGVGTLVGLAGVRRRRRR